MKTKCSRKVPIPCSSVHETRYYALKHGGKKGRRERKKELNKEWRYER